VIFALGCSHGPTLAFKMSARGCLARLMAVRSHLPDDRDRPRPRLRAQTGSAVVHAFYRVPNPRVGHPVSRRRVSPTQEAPADFSNGESARTSPAYAVAGQLASTIATSSRAQLR